MNVLNPQMGARFAAALVALGPVAAAAPRPAPPDPVQGGGAVWSRAHGVVLSEGRPLGGGPGYRITFTDAGFEFTPALGADAERSYPLAFELVSITRGSTSLALDAATPTLPAGTDATVRFDHGLVQADYAVGPHGVEQSFTFPTLPAGTGDLIVTGRLTTDMVASIDADGLLFEAPGLGGLRMGGVTGISADGASTSGELRLEGDLLQLVLPAEFVDSAAYPLVLDPLIGNVFTVGSNSDDSMPAIAYDQSTNTYLIAWKRAYSAIDSDILAQRVKGNPSAVSKLVGGLVFLDTVAAMKVDRPAVGNVNQTNRFLVAWEDDVFGVGLDDIKARAVAANSGDVSSILTVANTSAHEHHVAIGGEVNNSYNELMVVWGADSVGIQASNVRLPSSMATSPEPVVMSTWTISANSNDGSPSITQSGGAPGVHMVVWERVFLGAPGDKDLRSKLFSRDGTPLSPETPVASSPIENEQGAAVAGDGKHFLVVFEDETVALSGKRAIMSRPAAYDPALLFGPKSPIAPPLNDDNQSPAVAFTGEAFVVVWMIENGSQQIMAAASIDPFDGFLAEGPIPIDASTDNLNPAVASRFSGWSGSNAPDDALVTWEAHSSPGIINAQFYQTNTGAVTSLGGGCGSAGLAVATSAVSPNMGFSQRLLDGPPNSAAFLIMGFDVANYPCGPCKLVPNPFTSWVFATSTDSSGEASFNTPIPFATPSLIGVKFYQQWAVSDGSPACSTFSVDLSNANLVEIQ